MAAAAPSEYLAPREVWEKKIAEVLKEVDPKWIAVDEFTTGALDHEDVGHVVERAAAAGLPPIAAASVLAKFFALTAYTSSVTHALEIGTLAGLTAIRLAQANPQLHVTTVELHDVYADVARQNIQAAGLEGRIEVIVGPAVEVLPRLAAEVGAGKRQKFGFSFIDADSYNNWNYLDQAIKMSLPRASIVLDNMDVRTLTSEQERTKKPASQDCILKAGGDARIESLVMQTVGPKGWAGFMLCVVKD